MMKHTLKFILLICIATLMAGCKLAVIVVEGGEVQSAGSGICVEGTICIVDVDDPYFSETFTAIPDEGWYFHKWNSGDRFFCGDSTDPDCTLSFEGHEESKAVEDMVASSETFYLMPVFKPYKDVIAVDGKQWLQVDLFTNLSWNDINAVCPAGVCSGVLNGIDVTGWTWASINDVNQLFNYYIGIDVMGPGPDSYQESLDSAWATAFFSDGWRPTGPPSNFLTNFREIFGWMRNKSRTEEGYLGIIGDVFYYDGGFAVSDVASTTARHVVISDFPEAHGAWFYRTP
jgi:hypothetical protein